MWGQWIEYWELIGVKKSMAAVSIAAAFVVALGVAGCSSSNDDSGAIGATTSAEGGRTSDTAGTLTYKGDVKEIVGGKTTSLDDSIKFESMLCTVKDGKISTATASNIKLTSLSDITKVDGKASLLSYTEALGVNLVSNGIVTSVPTANVSMTDSTLTLKGDTVDVTYTDTDNGVSVSTGAIALNGTLTCTTIIEN